MLALVLGMGTATLWGVGDFVAGLQARRLPLSVVTVASQGSGTLVALAAILVILPEAPGGRQLALAALAGVMVAIGVSSYYGALATGAISVAAPIAATGVTIPVVFGLLAGERPEPVQLLGIGFAAAGGLLVSRTPPAASLHGARHGRSIFLAVAAALGFGWYFVAIDGTTGADPLWVLFAQRVAAFLVVAAALLCLRPDTRAIPARSFVILAAVGLADLGGAASYFFAASTGPLAVVSVLGSLYTVITVLLARAVLLERISRVQGLGVGSVMAGVGMIAAGS